MFLLRFAVKKQIFAVLCHHLMYFLGIRLNLFYLDTVTRLHLFKEGVRLWEESKRIKRTDPEGQLVFSSQVNQHHARKLPACDNCGALVESFEQREKNFLRILRQGNFLTESVIY